MPELSDFQILNLSGMEIAPVSWKGARLSVSFGDGYGASARVGASSGLWGWSIESGCLPDDDSYGNLINSLPRFQYYFEFFKEHITGDRDIFELEFRGKRYHASFVQNEFTGEMLTIDLFSVENLEIKQRRVEGILYGEDGAIFEVANLAGLYSEHLGGTIGTAVGNYWPNELDNGITTPFVNGTGDIDVGIDGPGGLHVARFNSETPGGFTYGNTINFVYEVYIVMKMREATFSNDAGILTSNVTVPFLLGDTGETKFTNIGHGADYEYRYNGELLAESNQTAPMNEWGLVHLLFENGRTLTNTQVGKDRAATDRYALMDIGHLIFVGSAAAGAPLSTTNSAKLTEFLMRKWALD